MKEVVGVAFFENGKLLISQSVKSAKKNKYTLVGGGIEENETVLQAAVRECKEEIQNGFEIAESDLEPIMNFTEHAASDESIIIHMHILRAKKTVDVTLEPNQEILQYHWFSEGEDESILSSSICDHLLPLARKLKLFY